VVSNLQEPTKAVPTVKLLNTHIHLGVGCRAVDSDELNVLVLQGHVSAWRGATVVRWFCHQTHPITAPNGIATIPSRRIASRNVKVEKSEPNTATMFMRYPMIAAIAKMMAVTDGRITKYFMVVLVLRATQLG
jgi:hypothetical protein